MAIVVLKDGTRVNTGMIRGPTGVKGQTVTVRPIKGGTMTEVRTSLGGGSSRRSVTRTRPGQVVVADEKGYIKKPTQAEKQLRKLEQVDPKLALAQRQAIRRQKQEQKKTMQLASTAQKEFAKDVEKGNLGPGTYRVVKDGREFFFTVDTDQSFAPSKQIEKALSSTPKARSGPNMSLEQKGVIQTKLYENERQKKNIFGRVFDDLTRSMGKQQKIVSKGGIDAVKSVLITLPLMSLASLGIGAAAVVTQPRRSYRAGKQIVSFAVNDHKTFFKSVGQELLRSGVTNPLGTALEVWVGGKGITLAMKTAYKGGKAVAVATGRVTRPILNSLKRTGKAKVPMTVKVVQKVGRRRVVKTTKKDVVIQMDESQINKLKLAEAAKAKGQTKLTTVGKMNQKLLAQKKKSMMQAAKAERPAIKAYNSIIEKLNKVGLASNFPNYSRFARYSLKYRTGLLKKYNKTLTAENLKNLKMGKDVSDVIKRIEGIAKTQRVKRERIAKGIKEAKRNNFPRYDLLSSSFLENRKFNLPATANRLKAELASLKKQYKAASAKGDIQGQIDILTKVYKLEAKARTLQRQSNQVLFSTQPQLVLINKAAEKVIDIAKSTKPKVQILKLRREVRIIKTAAGKSYAKALRNVRKAVKRYKASPSPKNLRILRSVFKIALPSIIAGIVVPRMAQGIVVALAKLEKSDIAQTPVNTITTSTAQKPSSVQAMAPALASAAISSLLVGSAATVGKYFTKPPAGAKGAYYQSGRGYSTLPSSFKARYSTLRRFNYIPDLESILYGVRATESEKRALKEVGRVFTGAETRKLV